MASGLSLRSADEGDAYALWVWANESETRAGSGGRDAFTWDGHVGWLRERLHSEMALVLIGVMGRVSRSGRFASKPRTGGVRRD